MADCKLCEHFAEFKEPFHYEALGYEEGVIVYGVCYKNCKNHICFPVYITDSGYDCTGLKKKKDVKVTEKDILQLEMDYLLGAEI